MAQTDRENALFNLGFRVFFSGAAVFACLSIGAWLWLLSQPNLLSFRQISLFDWHAHEMIYGYSLAVIAGFLLTAVRNWTNLPTPVGKPLAALFSLWCLGRILWFGGDRFLWATAVLDMAFILALTLAIAMPIIRVRQWRQMAILSKLILLGLGNALFYLEAFDVIEAGKVLALHGGLYLVIGLILTVGRRVIPFFIERGVDGPVSLFNAKWLDLSSMVFFLLFFVAELFLDPRWPSTVTASILFVITTVRLIGWIHPGIWSRPLLWSLLLALAFIDLGFLLVALQGWLELSPYLALHAFAVGGIGTITLSMMSRVSIGHTGRNLKTPPTLLTPLFVLIAASALIRAVLPAAFPEYYSIWLKLSGGLWMLAFLGFCYVFLPILRAPRPDGKPG